MNIIYIHGLDSSANSMKGQMIETYCQTHYPKATVLRPDLNDTPNNVFDKITDLVTKSEQTILVGSSLGGYFSTLVSNHTGCPALLLNPSTEPHHSLQRFLDNPEAQAASTEAQAVVYRTSGGWDVTRQDLAWFQSHIIERVAYPKRLFAIIKEGDELLDAKVSADFFQQQGVEVALQAGGNHRMTDFSEQLPLVMHKIEQLLKASS